MGYILQVDFPYEGPWGQAMNGRKSGFTAHSTGKSVGDECAFVSGAYIPVWGVLRKKPPNLPGLGGRKY